MTGLLINRALPAQGKKKTGLGKGGVWLPNEGGTEGGFSTMSSPCLEMVEV